MNHRMIESVKESKTGLRGVLYVVLAVVLTIVFIRLGMALALILWGLIFLSFSPLVDILLKYVDPAIVELSFFIVPAFLLYLWVRFGEKRSVRDLGFVKKGAMLELLKGWGIGFAMMTVVVLCGMALGAYSFTGFEVSFRMLLNFFLLTPFWLIKSGTEELFMRGWLFPVASKKIHLLVGIVISCLFFVVLPVGDPLAGPIVFLNIALLGLLACLYVLKTDNIWGVAGIHAAWNCFQASFYGLPVSGFYLGTPSSIIESRLGSAPEFLSGGSFGPEGSILSSLVMLIVIGYLAWDLKKKRLDKEVKGS